MKSKLNFTALLLWLPLWLSAQHYSKLTVDYVPEKQTLNVYQELTFVNTTKQPLTTIYLNDWNNAYSDRSTPLADRFADEFVRSFHVATDKERGQTHTLTVIDEKKSLLDWNRPANHPDIVAITLSESLAAGASVHLDLSYFLKLPDKKFTGYGYNDAGELFLKQWLLHPVMQQNGTFLLYSNLNIDDAANAPMTVDLRIRPQGYTAISDLEQLSYSDTEYEFRGKNRLQVHLYLTKEREYLSFNTEKLEITTNLNDRRINDIQKALLVEKIQNFVTAHLGESPIGKITVTQSDYEVNPFYGLNQLPNFIRPFPDDFVYELKFLKTYLYNRLKTNLQLDPRKDNWLFDAIQVYLMMEYIDEHYPDAKMMGALGKIKLLKGYKILSLDFNEQYSYFYMLMARKNLDQPLGDSKDKLLKFNEKIASKYRAGLSFKYLAEYLRKSSLDQSIAAFVIEAQQRPVTASDFQHILERNVGQPLDWFFKTIIQSRDIIDYKFEDVQKTKDSVSFRLMNRTQVSVPIPVYGIKKKEVVFKQWITPKGKDSLYTLPRKDADKIVLNYENLVPEYNQRNNWKSLKPFIISNRPIKLRLFRDLEDPYFNQIMYMPVFGYNYYDGVILGMSLNNKTVLDKPFIIEAIPSYSTTSSSLSGSFNVMFNNYIREGRLYSLRYGIGGSHFRYAPDATYEKLTPFVNIRIREKNFRENHMMYLNARQVYVNRQPSNYVVTTGANNYSVFNLRFTDANSTITKTFTYSSDWQFSSQFIKTSGELVYRQLFQNNRQLNIRFYGGVFLNNKDTRDYYSFALERPTDYMFDYSFLGRSENTGFFRQQYITAEGGFKSRFTEQLANHWLVSTNISGSIWNWIEAYADFGMLKDKGENPEFKMDSGIRLNLVTDYFELYFPVYSSNGWDIGQKNYGERIRFVITINPKSLLGLFTRKWF
ncbi:aminopeptidase [Flavobacterium sp. N1719]|uniref:aminopeptidase n=1 Tax=Flavobacterium sp. N1719 TaxID=2885633 RepID=UPI002221841E|nr:aminopeptidase [Flavobacterium sp. N1719]